MLNRILLFVLVVLSIRSSAQNYPKDYFLFPIKPGQKNNLSGVMGELRSNHFHGGLDVKTDGVIGYPVYAAADGYVSRIKVSSFGYGNVVYITHPNGYVTVYAHLDKFNQPIGDYVRKKQYEAELFDIEVKPKAGELPVKKADVIGLGGNSGSSGGPHLHFEIRDTTDRLYNPLLFGFSEIRDNIAPTIDKIALRTLSADGRINGEFGRFEFKPAGGSIPGVINVNGEFGIELKAYDKANDNHNHYGLATIKVLLDNKEIFLHDARTLLFSENRYINVHIDYETFINQGRRFEKCYISDGDKLTTYKTDQNKGKISLKDSDEHQVKLVITDGYNNTSSLSFKVKRKEPSATITKAFPKTSTFSSDLFENILKITAKANAKTEAKVYLKNKSVVTLLPAYSSATHSVYLYDLRKGLPDSIAVANFSRPYNFAGMVPSGKDQRITNGDLELFFPAHVLFDTLYLEIQRGVTADMKPVFRINSEEVALFDFMEVTYTVAGNIANKQATSVYSLTRSNRIDDFIPSEWNNNKIKFRIRSLGKFTLDEDNVQPVIRYISAVGNSIRFHIGDSKSGVGTIKATINDSWLLMNYDHKRSLIWSERLDKTVPLKGDFKLEIIDKSGNSNTFTIKL